VTSSDFLSLKNDVNVASKSKGIGDQLSLLDEKYHNEDKKKNLKKRNPMRYPKQKT
jgi:hypothetical protein